MTSPGAGDPREARAPYPPRPGFSPLSGADNWPAQAADLVVSSVDKVRDKTTGPLQTAARGIVYGILAAVAGTMVAVLLIITFIRGVDAAVSLFVDPPNIWITYLIVGVVFLVSGFFVFRRRRLAEF